MKIVNSPLKYFGGKGILVKQLVSLIPKHLNYVEPYCGSSVLLLNKQPFGAEIINDLDCRVTNFWQVLQNKDSFGEFSRLVNLTPFSQREFELAKDSKPKEKLDVIAAKNFFLLCRMSLAGTQKSFSPITKTRLRQGINENVAAYLSSVSNLDKIVSRLKNVVVLNQPAFKVIKNFNTVNTVLYCDPPYIHDTRTSDNGYSYEMTDIQHKELLTTLSKFKGKFLLSGYDNTLYNSFEQENKWNSKIFKTGRTLAYGKRKRVMQEKVWYNYDL